jgi:hypothetical protein
MMKWQSILFPFICNDVIIRQTSRRDEMTGPGAL